MNILEGSANITPETTKSDPAAAPSAPSAPQTTAWYESLPDELKSHGGLTQFKDVPSLAKSWVHAQGALSKKGIIPPGQNASEEEWSGFYKQLGQPELEKYNLDLPKEGVNEEVVNKFKGVMHKAGLLPKQASELVKAFVQHEQELIAKRQVEQKQKMEDGFKAIKKEWGDGYDKNINAAKMLVDQIEDPELQSHVRGLGTDPVVVKALAHLSSKLLGEDKLRGDGAGKFGQTPDELQSEIEKIMGEPSHPYFNRNHPGHDRAVSEVAGLYQALEKSRSA